MRAALFIEGKKHQVILTPENSTEEAILKVIVDGDFQYSTHRGNFATCRGGYIREFETPQSTMIVIEPKADGEGE